MITTGWLMGFGNGDFTPERLKTKLLNNVTNSHRVDTDPQERLYVSCALVLRRPLQMRIDAGVPNVHDVSAVR